jgi:hypothetical protein
MFKNEKIKSWQFFFYNNTMMYIKIDFIFIFPLVMTNLFGAPILEVG